MSFPQLVDTLSCSLNPSKHIFQKAIVLPCGASACKNCISNANELELKCHKCNQTHVLEQIKKSPENLVIDTILKLDLNGLYKYFHDKYIELVNNYNGII